ncbi:hypothetical protein Pan153_23120 [Gimesia panareensis]|uniref:Uncharacterized protein n=1 Tax=Gimesia panareensis TaxID=2527978 RepID=A0A518FMV5_9PLAN|nr:hypothetical protein Pan153_23120 [Gimesia panareensis]
MRTTGSWPSSASSNRIHRFQEPQKVGVAEAEYNLSDIAELNNQQIQRMTHQELEGVIDAARPMVLNERCPNRLSHFDQTTLKRLVYLARYCCQNQRARTQFSGNDNYACIDPQKK